METVRHHCHGGREAILLMGADIKSDAFGFGEKGHKIRGIANTKTVKELEELRIVGDYSSDSH